MNGVSALILLLALFSCAPMPGNTFAPGITHETSLNKMKLTVHKGNPISTSTACHKIMLKKTIWPTILSIPLNAGIVPACCEVERDGHGGVKACEVWHWGFGLEHELRHCMGYAEWP